MKSAWTSSLNFSLTCFSDIFLVCGGLPIDAHGVHAAVTFFIAFVIFGVSILASLNSVCSSLELQWMNLCTFLTMLISGRFTILAISEVTHELVWETISSHIRSSPLPSFAIYVKTFLLLLSFVLLNSMYVCAFMLCVLPYFSMSSPTMSGALPCTWSNGNVVDFPLTSKTVRYQLYFISFAWLHSVPHPCWYMARGGDRTRSIPNKLQIIAACSVPPVDVSDLVSSIWFKCV